MLKPDAQDGSAIRQKMAELDVLADERKPWLPFQGPQLHKAVIKIRSRTFTLTVVGERTLTLFEPETGLGTRVIRGTIQGREFTGKIVRRAVDADDMHCFGSEYEREARGTITPDGRTLRVDFVQPKLYERVTCTAAPGEWEHFDDFTAKTGAR